MNYLTVLASVLIFQGGGEEWSIDYESFQEGPRVVYKGTARLNVSQDNMTPCLSYTFELPEGRLAGPAISSSPGDPMIKFDWVNLEGKNLEVYWCKNVAAYYAQLPVSIPRYFVFYVIKKTFGPTDLNKLLSDWGLEDSPWDLNLDQAVDGKDLGILLGGWDSNEGTP